jgi:hypothetical protein
MSTPVVEKTACSLHAPRADEDAHGALAIGKARTHGGHIALEGDRRAERVEGLAFRGEERGLRDPQSVPCRMNTKARPCI